MTDFYKGLVAALVIMSLGWGLLIYGQLGKPVLSSRWVYDAYRKKVAIASRTRSPRILLIGGSNLLFGVDSGRISRELGLPVVNMGVNAGLQLPYILYEAKKVLRPGDIALLSLEYPEMYTYDGVPNQQIISYLYAFDPGFWKALTWKERFLFVWDTPLSRLIEGYLETGDKPVRSGLYGAHHIDIHGDQTHTTLADLTPAIRQERDSTPPKKITEKDLNDHNLAWNYLEEFHRWASHKGIDVYLIPSILMDDPGYHRGAALKFFQTLPLRARSHGLRFIGNPLDFLYPRNMFFNTNYHLNAPARKIHTQRIIDLLKRNRIIEIDGKRR